MNEVGSDCSTEMRQNCRPQARMTSPYCFTLRGLRSTEVSRLVTVISVRARYGERVARRYRGRSRAVAAAAASRLSVCHRYAGAAASHLQIILPFSLTGPQLLRASSEGEATAIIGVPRLYSAFYSGSSERLSHRDGLRAEFSTHCSRSVALPKHGCACAWQKNLPAAA